MITSHQPSSSTLYLVAELVTWLQGGIRCRNTHAHPWCRGFLAVVDAFMMSCLECESLYYYYYYYYHLGEGIERKHGFFNVKL